MSESKATRKANGEQIKGMKTFPAQPPLVTLPVTDSRILPAIQFVLRLATTAVGDNITWQTVESNGQIKGNVSGIQADCAGKDVTVKTNGTELAKGAVGGNGVYAINFHVQKGKKATAFCDGKELGSRQY